MFRFCVETNSRGTTNNNNNNSVLELGDIHLNDTDVVVIVFIESLIDSGVQRVRLSSSINGCRFQLVNENINQLSEKPNSSCVYHSPKFNQVI